MNTKETIEIIKIAQANMEWEYPLDFAVAFDMAIEALKREAKHGEWIEKPYLLGTTRYCSICNQNYGMPHGVYNYCPNCGAKMDGENEMDCGR